MDLKRPCLERKCTVINFKRSLHSAIAFTINFFSFSVRIENQIKSHSQKDWDATRLFFLYISVVFAVHFGAFSLHFHLSVDFVFHESSFKPPNLMPTEMEWSAYQQIEWESTAKNERNKENAIKSIYFVVGADNQITWWVQLIKTVVCCTISRLK